MVIIGIDPGMTGGVACYDTVTARIFYARRMPVLTYTNKGGKKTTRVNARMLFNDLEFHNADRVYLERVSAMPGQGVTSTFNFGMGFGVIIGVVEALAIPLEMVSPQTWKKHYKLGKDKNESRALATRMFPNRAQDFALVKDDGIAEAALLAAWGAKQCS